MKKLRLELDELRVDTFATTSKADRDKGTVRGHNSWNGQCETLPYEDSIDLCPPPYTAAATCVNSCYGTCGNTCAASCQGSCYNTCPGVTCPYIPEEPPTV